MKVIVIGATGTIGAEVAKALSANQHKVVRASRHSDIKVDLEDRASIVAPFEKVRNVDTVISCAGDAVFKPLAELTDADFEFGLRNRLMGQVSLARIAKDHVCDSGSVTLTTGVLAIRPMPGRRARRSTPPWKILCAPPPSRCRESCGSTRSQIGHGSDPPAFPPPTARRPMLPPSKGRSRQNYRCGQTRPITAVKQGASHGEKDGG